MFFTKIRRNIAVMWQLIVTDLAIFRSSMVGSMIDTGITIFLIVSSMTYIMPLLGITQDYGPFAAWAAIPSACIFELYGFTFILIADIRGERPISNRLILPLPTYLVFVAKGVTYACKVATNAFVALLISVILLASGGRLSTAHLSLIKLSLLCCTLFLFVGFFTLFVASLAKDAYRIGSLWTRILYPLWYLGGAQFSWQTTHDFSPILGSISLLNPILYLMEGIHAATLNPGQYLNFWLCIFMALTMTLLFGIIGIKQLKNQLRWV